MKKILAIISRDIKSGLRDWLIVYLSVVPFLIAFILRLIIPSVGDSLLTVAVLEDDPIKHQIEEFTNIEVFSSEEDIKERVLRMDDVFGIVNTDESSKIIAQGNEPEQSKEMLLAIIEHVNNPDIELPLEISFSDIGWEMSPLKHQGGIFLFIFTTIFGGMFIVLNFVDEKMHDTLKALNVSTISRPQMVFGKGILGFLLPIIGCLGAYFILGFPGINIGMFIYTIISIALISIIIGFSIGVVNDEPISAVASMKVVFVPVLASIFGAMYLAPKWQFLLYWSPYYYAYKNFDSILLQNASWGNVILNNSLILVITVIVFILLRKRISQGFN